MNDAYLTWNRLEWLGPLAAWGALCAILIVVVYARRTRDPRTFIAAAAKVAAVAILVAWLLEPAWHTSRPTPRANTLAVLVDTSRSMQLMGRGVPAADDLRRWLDTQDNGTLRQLEQDFTVRYFAFDRDLREVDCDANWEFQGASSNLHAALQALQQRSWDHPLAGIVVVTDGNATDDERGSEPTQDEAPVFPLVSARAREVADVRIDDLAAKQTPFESSPVTITGNVVVNGLQGPLSIQLVDPQGHVVAQRDAVVDAQRTRLPYEFRFRPETSGICFYRVRAALTSALKGLDDGNLPMEATAANNGRTVMVQRGGGPFRILYLSGRPNWEFKFLRRAMQDDLEFQLVGLIRIAQKEGKFVFRDTSGTSRANRLFQGFDDVPAEDLEPQDRPVLVRLGIHDAQELASGFPANDEELFRYEGLILDDIEASFFTTEQQLLIRRYVAERGGGLMMLGGVGSYAHGGYARTPIGDLLPVYVDAHDRLAPSRKGVWELTRDGWLEHWLRLRETEQAERQRIAEMPPFQIVNRMGRAKPGAMVVSQVVEEATNGPALATQRFGNGRVAALAVGDVWRWSLGRHDLGSDDASRFWRQALRWLVVDTPPQLAVSVEAPRGEGEAVRLRAVVRDAQFQADDQAAVRFDVTDPAGTAISVVASSDDQHRGEYVAEFWPRLSGGYRAMGRAQLASGESLAAREVGWVFEPTEHEWERLEVDRARLTRLATRTKGQLVDPQEFARWTRQLERRSLPVREIVTIPLWHRSWMFGAAITCLLIEWTLRRSRGWA